MKTFAYARHYNDVLYNFEDFQLPDINTAIDEVMIYKQFGGGTLVDAGSIGVGRDPIGLARISRQTGVNIVMGASYYVAITHPKDMDDMTEDSITEKIIDDLINGVDNTGIRAGIIGEIGCGFPIDDNELKVLRGSAQAQTHTGFPVLVHPGRDVTAPLDNLNTLLENGADTSKIILTSLRRFGLNNKVTHSTCLAPFFISSVFKKDKVFPVSTISSIKRTFLFFNFLLGSDFTNTFPVLEVPTYDLTFIKWISGEGSRLCKNSRAKDLAPFKTIKQIGKQF